MIRKTGWGVLALVLFASMALGCKTTSQMLTKPNDNVLIYDLPYDLVYLKTLEAVQTLPDWELNSTQKENGLIKVYNTAYSKPNDADQRAITFVVKLMAPGKTQVQIDPEDQRIPGGEDLLKAIASKLNDAY